MRCSHEHIKTPSALGGIELVVLDHLAKGSHGVRSGSSCPASTMKFGLSPLSFLPLKDQWGECIGPFSCLLPGKEQYLTRLLVTNENDGAQLNPKREKIKVRTCAGRDQQVRNGHNSKAQPGRREAADLRGPVRQLPLPIGTGRERHHDKERAAHGGLLQPGQESNGLRSSTQNSDAAPKSAVRAGLSDVLT